MSEQVCLRAVDIVGSQFCVASDDGQKVHDAIAPALRAGKRVVLSFEGVTDVTSAFLNAAIGQLYSEFSEQEIKAGLSVSQASNDDLYILKRVVDRAKEFFKEPSRFEQAVAEVLGEDDDA